MISNQESQVFFILQYYREDTSLFVYEPRRQLAYLSSLSVGEWPGAWVQHPCRALFVESTEGTNSFRPYCENLPQVVRNMIQGEQDYDI